MKKYNLAKGLLISLLTLALCFSCFGYVKAKAAEETEPEVVEAEYVPGSDSIKASSKAVAYVLKKASGETIKAGATAYALAAGKEVPLSDLGVKGTKNDVYLHIVSKEYKDGKEGASATMTIKGQAAKKITGLIDYTKVDATEKKVEGNTEVDNLSYYQILSASCLDANKNEITEPTPVIYWSEDANGKFYKASLEQSDLSEANAKKYAFTTKILKKYLENGGTIYIKQLGIAGDENIRTSSAVKVKIAKQGKAVSIKLDVAKDILSLKNGFDFGMAAKSGKTYNVYQWYTILPVLKGAATKTAGDSIVATTAYLPVSKKATTAKLAIDDDSREGSYANKVSYTSYKFKNVGLEAVVTTVSQSDDPATTDCNESNPYEKGFILAVRKSATEKKPASEVAYFTISRQTPAPLVMTESCVSGQYIVSSGDNFDKGLLVGEVKNYPGTTGSSGSRTIATSGYWQSFKIEKATNKDNDTNGATYQFAIVKAENLVAITESSSDEDKAAAVDWTTVAWKKFDPAKTKITSKLKTKYSTMGGSAVEATLNAVEVEEGKDLTVSADIPTVSATTDDDPQTYILIRRAGTKGKTASDSVLASNFTKLYVAKQDKTFYIMATESVGSAASKYTINFAKFAQEDYQGTSLATSDVAGKFTVIKTIEPIVGWIEAGKTLSDSATDKNLKSIVLPALSDGKYVLNADIDAGKKDDTIQAVANLQSPTLSSDNKKFTFKMAEGNTSAQTYTLIIREFANVKITAKYSVEDGDAAVKDLVLTEWVKGVDKKVTSASGATKFVGNDLEVITSASGAENKITFPKNYDLKTANGWTAVNDIDVPENAKLTLENGIYKIQQIASGSVAIEIPVELKQKEVTVTIDAGEGKFEDLPDGWTLAANGKTATQKFKVTLKSGSTTQLQVKVTLPAATKAVKSTSVSGETTTTKGSKWKEGSTEITSPYTKDISDTAALTFTVEY